MLQAIPFWIASIITGLIAVIYTKLFLLAEVLTSYVFHHSSWLLFLLTPICFILKVVLRPFNPKVILSHYLGIRN
ncbi:hypothetical protein [Pedobacter nyackensis]|uniref:hypothetical protein n=1 Tax=Pedobacter nyackensis TaxID=475255 RepID=UPI0029301E84|nr:hypothetical protein [Pedobacter nyackensis]